MTDAQIYFIGIHGVSKERQDRGDTEVISRAEANRQTQEAVAAALMEAARLARAAPDGEIAYDDILALALAADAPAATLAKWGARVRAEERERCARVADAQQKEAQENITALLKEFGAKTALDIWVGRRIAAVTIAAAIREGGEA